MVIRESLAEYLVKSALGLGPESKTDFFWEKVDKMPGQMYDLLTAPLANYVAKKALGLK